MIKRKTLVASLIIAFIYIWLVPHNIGYIGESPVCKFRMQVYECDFDDYGSSENSLELLFKAKPIKYGTMRLFSKIGGWKEYFGFTKIYNLKQ